MKIIDEFLRPLNGKGGDDNLTMRFYRIVHRMFQYLHRVVNILVPAISVGAFYHNIVGSRDNIGVANNRFILSAEISGKCNLYGFTGRIFCRDKGYCGTENVSRIIKFKLHIRPNPYRTMIRDRYKLIDGLHGIFFGKKRLPIEFFVFFDCLFL